MTKQKITAKALAEDIRAGMSNKEIMQKYAISGENLKRLFNQLLDAKIVDKSEILDRPKKTSAAPSPKSGPLPVPQQKTVEANPELSKSEEEKESEDEVPMIRTCLQCGYKAAPWTGDCPQCGNSDAELVDHIYGNDPVAIIARFFASALFGFFVSVVVRYTLGRIIYLPLPVYLVLIVVWGIIGIFKYDEMTDLSREMYEWFIRNRSRAAIGTIIVAVIFYSITFMFSGMFSGTSDYSDSDFNSGRGAPDPESAVSQYYTAKFIDKNAGEAVEYLSNDSKVGLCTDCREMISDEAFSDDLEVLSSDDLKLSDEELIIKIIQREIEDMDYNEEYEGIDFTDFEITETKPMMGISAVTMRIGENNTTFFVSKEGDNWYVNQ